LDLIWNKIVTEEGISFIFYKKKEKKIYFNIFKCNFRFKFFNLIQLNNKEKDKNNKGNIRFYLTINENNKRRFYQQ